MPEEDKYKEERYNPTRAHCHSLSLRFDGKSISLLASGRVIRSYGAVSGKPIATKNGPSFDYSDERQKQAGRGPIPQGIYWVRPEEIWSNAWYKRGSTSSWGNFRLTIHPFEDTNTYGRGGFFIHGGSNPGSIGCIDLTTDIDRFTQDLRREVVGGSSDCHLHLIVDYRTAK